MMIFVNDMTPKTTRPHKVLEPFVLILALLLPILLKSSGLKLGKSKTLSYEPFPAHNPEYLVEDTITIVVQGKWQTHGEFTASKTISESEAIAEAKKSKR